MGCSTKGVAPVREKTESPVFFDPSGKAVSSDTLMSQIADADFILVGEAHTNPCDHRAQLELVSALKRSGKEFILGLEMVAEEKQPVLDSFSEGNISLLQLPEELEWSENWGHDFDLYRPALEASFQAGARIWALNINPKVLAAVRNSPSGGLEGIAEDLKKSLPAKIVYPGQSQMESLNRQIKMHRKMMAGSNATRSTAKFLLVQSLWDSKMAERALQGHRLTGRSMLILAGAGHVENGWGIEYRLLQLDPALRVARIVPVRSVSEMADAAADSRANADEFYFLCPSRHRSRLGIEYLVQNRTVSVVSVRPDSKGAKAGFESGDVIKNVNGQPVHELGEIHRQAMQSAKAGEALVFDIVRKNNPLTLELEFTSK